MGKVGAPYGNKNAEKWTFKRAVQLFNDAIELTQEITEIPVLDNKKNVVDILHVYEYDFIGEIARQLGTFHMIFIHLPKRFPILERLKTQLDNNIESNCYYNTKKGYIREATGIVNLKSNWKWTDRSQTDLSNKDGTLTRYTISVESERARQALENIANKKD